MDAVGRGRARVCMERFWLGEKDGDCDWVGTLLDITPYMPIKTYRAKPPARR